MKKVEILNSMESDIVIGHVPSYFLKYGVSVFAFFIIVVVVFFSLIETPVMLSGRVVIPDNKECINADLYISPFNTGEIHKGQDVNIKLFNYPFEKYGSLYGSVDSVVAIPNENGEYHVIVNLKHNMVTDRGCKVSNQIVLVGTGSIILSKKTIMDKVLNSIIFTR